MWKDYDDNDDDDDDDDDSRSYYFVVVKGFCFCVKIIEKIWSKAVKSGKMRFPT